MEHTAASAGSLSSASIDQPINCKGWERFLPERPLRILLVEDDGSTRQVVCALLSKCGYEVSCACDGVKAWDLLEQSAHTFDLVLADAMMPVLSGTDLLAKIISSESHRHMPVIMMSAHDSLDMVFKCLLKGAKDFLVKPLRKNELRNLWQHVWRKNHALGRFGSQCDVHAAKTNPSRTLSLNCESSDSLSLSTDTDDKLVCENGSDAQFTGAVHSKKTLEANNALRTSKEFDFLGTTMAESEQEQIFSEVNLTKQISTSPQLCQAPKALDLTKSIKITTHYGEKDPDGKQGVRQSNCSAFSKYTSNAALMRQPCIAKSISLLDDQYVHACCSSTGNILNSDTRSRTTEENCEKVNDGLTVSGNYANSTTLHFPKATHFKHRVQKGDSSFLCVPSCHEGNSGQIWESFSNFRSPSLNSSTAHSLQLASMGGNMVGNDQLKRMDLQKDAHIAGSVWCSTGSDKDDFSSSSTKFSQLVPRPNTDGVDTDPDKYGVYGQSNMPMNISGLTNEFPTHTAVSGRGSNNGSDRGSSMIEEAFTGKSVDCVAGQDGHCASGWDVNEDDRMDLDSCEIHAYNLSNAPDQKPLVYDYQLRSFREAALHKFREKRKLRCFEKRVRYQSRKKLAEQRPRIKGQFVRRETFETAPDAKASFVA